METYLYILCVYPLLYMGDILLITYGDILLNPTFKWGNEHHRCE